MGYPLPFISFGGSPPNALRNARRNAQYAEKRIWGFLLTILAIALVCHGCRRGSAPAEKTRPTVASLVPAATDLIIAMGAADHLVAVSNFDVRRPETESLPRVGDYQHFDWERLSVLKPDVMIVFMAEDRMPEGLRQRAAELNIKLVNIRTERLEDIFTELKRLGDILEQPQKAAQAALRLEAQLEEVRRRVEGRPRVRTLLVSSSNAEAVIGRNTFVDDLLQIAGGENVEPGAGWLNIDKERLASLSPDAIVQLLPEASPQVLASAQQVWRTFPRVPAVANGRVHVIDDWWALNPGANVGELAQRMALHLHPPSEAGP